MTTTKQLHSLFWFYVFLGSTVLVILGFCLGHPYRAIVPGVAWLVAVYKLWRHRGVWRSDAAKGVWSPWSQTESKGIWYCPSCHATLSPYGEMLSASGSAAAIRKAQDEIMRWSWRGEGAGCWHHKCPKAYDYVEALWLGTGPRPSTGVPPKEKKNAS